MDRCNNPFCPGAGFRPPELVGRSRVIEDIEVALTRVRRGIPDRSTFMVGLRGVGKTVLLMHLKEWAESKGFMGVEFEFEESKKLSEMMGPPLYKALTGLDKIAKVKDVVANAIKGLTGLVGTMRYEGLELGLRVANSGHSNFDLLELMRLVGEAAKSNQTAVVFFIDELQYVPQNELATLIVALQFCATESLPITLVGAGLPQLLGHAVKAKSYAERLFYFPEIGALEYNDVVDALQKPLEKHDIKFSDDAIQKIFEQTQGYPYFIQQWGRDCWDVAKEPLITLEDVRMATIRAIDSLDAGFFRSRFDRCTPTERAYMRAMAEVNSLTPRSSDIAGVMNKELNQLAPLRASLIKKGMIYSPAHGDAAFTVPLFADYLKRTVSL
ncbi:MAG: ATP-binding protein [Gammaproteobacteria bacterium]|nr:ATP-binding protein [Gammaproteobacteria bacterium]